VLDRVRVLCGSLTRALTEHVDVQQRVGAKTVRSVDRHTCAFAGCVKTGNNMVVVAQDFGFYVGGNTTHCVVGGGEHGNQFGDRVNPEVGAGKLRNVREFWPSICSLGRWVRSR